ncbi:MAG: shikimate kinase [Muribaculaceae bacterium]|nr:shikimate kinase [Muribaculaceae bacterium]
MRPIFLVGYMGCGKSTLSRAVSCLTGLTFIDLDKYIENRDHASVGDLFALRGEQGFRILEQRMLHEVAEFENVIVACGGGTPCFSDNMDYMNARGLTVWLDTPVDRLFSRLKRGRAKRPLIAGKSDEELLDFIRCTLESRKEFYAKAAETFCSELLENKAEIDATAQLFVDKMIMPQQH